jgi:dynein heavy chain
VQASARRQDGPLDKLALVVDVATRKPPKDVLKDSDGQPRDGVLVSGLFLDGARWDAPAGSLVDPSASEARQPMPNMQVRTVLQEKLALRASCYACPVYQTARRARTYVFAASLPTVEPAAKWVLAGVALLLDATD